MDNCPEMVNAEAPRPLRVETAVEFWSGMGVETAARAKVDICPERMHAAQAAVLTMRRCFWCTRKSKKQEAAGAC